MDHNDMPDIDGDLLKNAFKAIFGLFSILFTAIGRHLDQINTTMSIICHILSMITFCLFILINLDKIVNGISKIRGIFKKKLKNQ